MSLLFTDPFTGNPGDEVGSMYKTKGGSLFLKYNVAGSAIIPNDTAADIRYRHAVFPASKNYRWKVRFQFAASSFANRIIRVFARYDLNNANGYYVQIETNFNDPIIKLFRLVSGTAAQIGSTFNPGVGTIPDDTDRDVEIQCDEDTIMVFWNGNSDLENPDISAVDTNVYVHMPPGVGCEQCGSIDIQINNGECNTPYKAAAPPAPTGAVLTINGEQFDETAMKANGIQVMALTYSLLTPDQLQITQKRPFTLPAFKTESTIEYFHDISGVRTRVFHGKIRNRPQQGKAKSETIQYTAWGYRTNWQYIEVEHPQSQSSEIVWNATPRDQETQEQDVDYDSRFANMTVGQYIKYWLDYYVDTVHFYLGSDPLKGQPYDQADMDTLTNKPTKNIMSGTLDQHILEALSHHRYKALYMDYDAGKMRIRDLASLTTMDLSLTADRINSVDIGLDTTKVFTAARAKGVKRELIKKTAKLTDDEIDSDWDTNLESFWTPDKANRNSMVDLMIATISYGGGSGGRDVFEVGSTDEMYENEWKGVSMEFTNGPSMHDHYEIFSNSAKKVNGLYDIVVNGNVKKKPNAGDMLTIKVDWTKSSNKKHNGFAYVYKAFKITDVVAVEINKDKCPKLNVSKFDYTPGNQNNNSTQMVPIKTFWNLPVANIGGFFSSIPIYMPPIGMINPLGNNFIPMICGVLPSQFNAFKNAGGEMEFQYEYYVTTVAQARFPEEGWYGPAFSLDTARYGSLNAVPKQDDPCGIMREELIQDSEFRYADQKKAWEEILEERVKVSSLLPWSGTIVMRGLDWRNRTFSKKLTISSGVRNTGWEDAGLVPIEIVWDFLGNTTTYNVGTLNQFAREVEKQKQTQKGIVSLMYLRGRLRALEDMQACNQARGGEVDTPDPNPQCGANMMFQNGNQVTNFNTNIRNIWGNKGAMESTIMGHAGPLSTRAPSYGTGASVVDMFVRAASPNNGSYLPDSDGYTRQAGAGLAAPQLGGALGGLGGNGGVTFDGAGRFGSGPGTVLKPGAYIGEDGAYYHPPYTDDWVVRTLEPFDTVPATVPMQARAIASGSVPMRIYESDDPGGVVWADMGLTSDGTRYWRCDPFLIKMRQVEQTTPGQGLNGGQWENIHPAVFNDFGFHDPYKFSVVVRSSGALVPTSVKQNYGYPTDPTRRFLKVGQVLVGSTTAALGNQDGVALAVNDRVLLLDEADATKNGLYQIIALGGGGNIYELWRTEDFDSVGKILPGSLVYVEKGTIYEKTRWQQTALTPLVPHTDTQVWEQFGGTVGIPTSVGAYKLPVRVVTNASMPAYTRVGNVITANVVGALPLVDSIALAVGERALLRHGAAPADNGIYIVTDLGSGGTSWVWTRADDADTSADFVGGMLIPVAEGTSHADSVYIMTANDPITLNTTALAFAKMGQANQLGLGTGAGWTNPANADGTTKTFDASATSVNEIAQFLANLAVSLTNRLVPGP